MQDKRDLTIHFTDGTKLNIDFPKQADNEYAAGIKSGLLFSAHR